MREPMKSFHATQAARPCSSVRLTSPEKPCKADESGRALMAKGGQDAAKEGEDPCGRISADPRDNPKQIGRRATTRSVLKKGQSNSCLDSIILLRIATPEKSVA